jgi:PIN domain nuclease of toxin-antitoxin system
VLDTHALYWYWYAPARLGPAAQAAFGELEAERNVGLVPQIVIAELHHLLNKLGRSVLVEELLRRVDAAPSLRLEGLARQHLLAFGQLVDIPEMHDRLIGAVALVHDAPVVSRDRQFANHSRIRVVW